jgi:hypothetical protein
MIKLITMPAPKPAPTPIPAFAPADRPLCGVLALRLDDGIVVEDRDGEPLLGDGETGVAFEVAVADAGLFAAEVELGAFVREVEAEEQYTDSRELKNRSSLVLHALNRQGAAALLIAGIALPHAHDGSLRVQPAAVIADVRHWICWLLLALRACKADSHPRHRDKKSAWIESAKDRETYCTRGHLTDTLCGDDTEYCSEDED